MSPLRTSTGATVALEIVCAGICPTCRNWDAVWRGVDTTSQGTTYLFIDCDVCDPPSYTLRSQVARWIDRRAA